MQEELKRVTVDAKDALERDRHSRVPVDTLEWSDTVKPGISSSIRITDFPAIFYIISYPMKGSEFKVSNLVLW